MKAPSHALIAFCALLLFGLSWGATLPLTKIAVSTGHQPIGLIFWQFVFGIVLLGIMIAIKRISVPLDRRHLFFYTVIALVGTLIPNSFSFLAAAQLPAGIMAVAIATVPMFSLMMALIIGNEKFRIGRSVGVVLGVSAMMLIALPEASLPVAGQHFWVFVALLAPICYGFEGNYVAWKAPPALNPIATLWGASIIGAAVALPISIMSGQFIDLSEPWGAPEYAMAGSSVAHVIAYAGYLWLVGFAGVVFTAQIAYVVTIGAIVISMVFLAETYSAYVWLAIAMMIGGLMLVQPIGKLPEDEAETTPNL